MRIRRLLVRSATIVGAGLMSTFSLLLVGIALRFAQVLFFWAPPVPEHLPAKQAYLEHIARSARVAGTTRPNFIVVLFDDLGYGDLSSYGNRLIETPRIDALASRGVRMTDFYAAAPVCTPSRAALLTGRFPFRAGTGSLVFFPNDSPIGRALRFAGLPNEVRRDEIFLPEALKAAGYATGMIGKWHLGDLDGHRPNDLGFEDWFGVLWSNDMQPLHVYRNGRIEQRDETAFDFIHAYRDEEDPRPQRGIDQRSLTRSYTREAIAFLERTQAEGARPFFLYLAHSAPHVPHFPSPDFAGRSRGGVYGDVVEELDHSTGELLDAVERLGLAQNTLVLVTSDNGADYGGSPGPLRGRKGEDYEGGQRVPMIAVWPGRIAPAVNGEMAMNIDFFPTILGLAGIALPDDRILDGRDLAPTWSAGARSPHDALYFFDPSAIRAPRVSAVRDGGYKYRLESRDRGRSHPFLTSLAQDAEAHDLRQLLPEEARRLAAEAAALQAQIDVDPRGID